MRQETPQQQRSELCIWMNVEEEFLHPKGCERSLGLRVVLHSHAKTKLSVSNLNI